MPFRLLEGRQCSTTRARCAVALAPGVRALTRADRFAVAQHLPDALAVDAQRSGNLAGGQTASRSTSDCSGASLDGFSAHRLRRLALALELALAFQQRLDGASVALGVRHAA